MKDDPVFFAEPVRTKETSGGDPDVIKCSAGVWRYGISWPTPLTGNSSTGEESSLKPHISAHSYPQGLNYGGEIFYGSIRRHT